MIGDRSERETFWFTDSASAMPTDFVRPVGTFADISQEWELRLFYNEFGAYSYEAVNTKNGSSLTLKNPEVSREEQAYIYTFKNGKYRYRVIYNASNPGAIALYVFSPSGKVILNRQMFEGYGRPQGMFTDDNQEWAVNLFATESGDYTYEGKNLKTGSKINLKNPKSWREEQAYFYVFKNGDYRYQVSYNPADKRKITLFVYDPNGNVILDRELTQEFDI